MRTVVGDEALEGAADAIVAAGRAVDIGLLIGKLSTTGTTSRDFVVGLVRTPVKEDGADAAELVSSSGNQPRSRSGFAALMVDTEWVAEHSRQVSRMLLGDLSVVGVYCLVPDSAFKQSTAILCQVLKAIQAATPGSKSKEEYLILHIATSPRRLACKSCTIEANPSLKPCEWKLAKLVPNLQRFACSYDFDASIPVISTADTETYKEKLLSWTNSEMKRIQSAEVLINGKLTQDEKLSSGDKNVQLLLPMSNKAVEDFPSSTGTMGIINLKGAVVALAYSFPREPLSVALDAIKEDIIRTLSNRIEILCDETEQQLAQEASDTPSLLSNCGKDKSDFTVILPKRVLLPWNGLLVCDYMLPSETMKETEERYNFLFRQPLAGDALQPEEFFIQPETLETLPQKGESKNKFFTWISALFGILVPIIVALAVAFLRD